MNRAYWLDRPVLVTGASGLVGSWMVGELLEAKAEVVCFTRDFVPQSIFFSNGFAERVKTVRGDIRDISAIRRAIQEYDTHTVIHLAAQTLVGVANRDPLTTFESNIQGTWNLLEACRASGCVKSVVIASSDKAYGTQPVLPYTENAPLQGEHPYDVSKSCADLISHAYAKTYGTPVAITRCGNFYGGGDLNWSRIIPGTIRSAIRGEAPIIRSNGLFVRDYLFVEDGADGYLTLAEQLANRPELHGQAFNFSIERPINVIDLVSLVLKQMDSGLTPVIQDNAPNEIPNQYLSAERARTLLGWKPQFTLEAGLSKTIEWYRQFFAGKTQAMSA